MSTKNTVTLEGPEEDLKILANAISSARLSKFQAATGYDIARLLIENFSLTDINVWIAQGLLMSELIKKIAKNLNVTIKEARGSIHALRSVLSKWHADKNARYVVWDGEKCAFSSDMPPEKRKEIISILEKIENESS